ncbi:cupin domain-containing protein [Roseibium sp.]|uniref:cupin domain-containing protein n=1 Tax=Roseibium sp. TaxID=1936156 RepID=UPI003A970655
MFFDGFGSSRRIVAALTISIALPIAGTALAADKAITPATKPGAAAGAASGSDEPYAKVVEVFSGDTTIAGEKVVFPTENPGVKSLIVTMEPGEKTAWHQHGTPLYAYILEGELTVTYEGIGDKLYTEGMGLLEAMHVTHRGHNTGNKPVRILAVFLTGDGGKPTVAEEAPK